MRAETGNENTNTRRAVERYLREGFAVIPVPAREKNPNRQDWQHERWTLEDVPRLWSNGQGIGALLGEPSGGLVDVDLDAPELVRIAGRFLPPTLTSGRAGAPDSHWWYIVAGNVRREEFVDLDEVTLLEIRGTGHHTLMPPSVHPSGERCRWSASGLAISRIEVDDLLRAGRELSTACLIARTLPPVGGRHRIVLPLAGFLLRRGLGPESVARIMLAGWDAAGYPDDRARRDAHRDIESTIAGTAERIALGEPVQGGRKLGEIKPGLPRKIGRYWGWSAHEPRPEPRTEPDGFRLTDLGNAERLVARHGRDLRYVHPWGKWLAWDGKRWRLDAHGEIARRAVETVRSIYAEAEDAATDDKRKEVARWAMASESRNRIESMIALARSLGSVPVAPEELDADPWLLNLENGTLDLRTGDLRAHDRVDLITKLAPVEYDLEATAPTWEAALGRWLPTEGLRRFAQRLVGYALTGDVSEQVLPFLHGPGANGKTTFINTVLAVAGDYGQQAAPDLLLAKHGTHPTELADLYGARVVASIEVEDGRRLAESLVKQITGGDKIRARRMREDFWEFDPTHKVLLVANHKPVIRGTDHAIWRRVKLVPFDNVIPKAEQDSRLPEKLRTELPGVLAWAVRGCMKWQTEGLGEPDEVRLATATYRQESDALTGFIEDACTLHPDAWAKFKDLWAAYGKWIAATNERYQLTRQQFADRLTERGLEADRGTGNVAIRRGIALRFDDDPDPT